MAMMLSGLVYGKHFLILLQSKKEKIENVKEILCLKNIGKI